MIGGRHTFAGRVVADLYSGLLMDKAFRKIGIEGEFPDNGRPILMIANHFSWWDGFIQYRLNKAAYDRTLYVMMLEEQLEKHPLLKRCGCFSVHKGSREIIESLSYCCRLLDDPGNMALIFPQGKIESMHIGRFRFENGLGYILKHSCSGIQIIFNVNLVDYFSGKKPSLTIYVERYEYTGGGTKEIEDAFNIFAVECIARQTEKTG